MLYIIYILFYISITHVYCNWIDPDTISSFYQTKSFISKKKLNLVFSDEFNQPNRQFHDGYDSKWTAINKNDYTNFALQYYNSDLISTSNGYLNISTIINDISFDILDSTQSTQPKKSKKTKVFQSGMLQGWNKFCFTGGIVEIKAKLPGKANIGGLWPAIWLLGNLVRATYVSSSNNVWPWSYNECNKDLQSQQMFSACNIVNHFDFHALQGRGAPEIDILEVMPGKEELINTPIHKPYLSTSLQIAPAIQDYRPTETLEPDYEQWYHDGLEYGINSSLNIFFYGMHLEGITKDKSYSADAISSNTNLSDTYFDDFHTYRLEWSLGNETTSGYLKWFIDDIFRFHIPSKVLNKTGAILPHEPMYLILNTAISSTWGFPIPCPEGCACDCYDPRKDECQCALPHDMLSNFPAHFLIDYIRIYQDQDDPSHIVGCSTKEYPTRTYISAHPTIYTENLDGSITKPLKPIQRGGHSCSIDKHCGETGKCQDNKCICHDDRYTGPNCLSAVGFDDIIWDPYIDEIPISSIFIPWTLRLFIILFIITLILVIIHRFKVNTSQRGPWRMSPSLSLWDIIYRNFSQRQQYQEIIEIPPLNSNHS